MPEYFDEDLIIGRHIRPFAHPRDPSIKLWRYMPWDYLKDLLQRQNLYLRRIDSFPDRLEGVLPMALEAYWRADWIRNNRSLDELPAFLDRYDIQRYYSYASCWRMDQQENFRAWEQYQQDTNSIAIQTTFTRLSEVFPQAAPISTSEFPIGCIRYFERLAEGIPSHNTLLPLMFKDITYKWENEIRILKRDESLTETIKNTSPEQRTSCSPVNLYAPCNTDRLLETIYYRRAISPKVLSELKELVTALSPSTRLVASQIA